MTKQYIVTLTDKAESLTAEEIHTLLTDDLEDDYSPDDVYVQEVLLRDEE